MPILDALTDAIANPSHVRSRQEKAAQRMFEGLDKRMRAVGDVSPEPTPSGSNDDDSRFARLSSMQHSRAPSQDRPLRPTRPRPELQRSYSELPIKAMDPPPKPTFAPCITAIELSSDDIRRNYSVNDLQKWDKAKYPLPPLNTMSGLGRYRTSVTADPEWRTEHFRKQLSGLDGLQKMVAELDMTEINGMSSQEWQALTGPSSRRGSVISTNSTRTTSSGAGIQEPMIDPQTGARISRGFSPSGSSSARSSFNVHSRKGSTLSVRAKPEEFEVSTSEQQSQRQSPVSIGDRRGSGLLSTISEVQSSIGMLPDSIKKLPRPCEFSYKGDPDSAVASDVDDDDAAWTDEAESARVSAITQMLKEGKKSEPLPGLVRVRTSSSDNKRRRSNMNLIDRTKTVRAPTGPVRQRRSSKHSNLHVLHQRIRSEDTRTDYAAMMLPTPESADNPPLVMHMKNSIGFDMKGCKTQPKKFANPVAVNDGTLLAEQQLEFAPRGPRKRAPTALFCRDEAVHAGITAPEAV